MAERVFSTLGHWVTLDDDALDAAIREVGLRSPTRRCALRARELFACALETPGGLKVQTIHALCTRLLQQFPFEANVPARFSVLDDRDQTEMMERANLAVLLDAARDPDSAAGPRAQHRDGERGRRHLQGRDARGVPEPRSFHGLDGHGRQRRCRGRAGIGRVGRRSRRPHRGRRRRDCRWAASAAIAMGSRSRRVLDTGSKSDQDQAARLREALTSTGATQVDDYLAVFLTESDRPCANHW